MGIDLQVIANHNIEFAGRNFGEISYEIKTILDNIVLPNKEYLRSLRLKYNNNNYQALEKIEKKIEWEIWDGTEEDFESELNYIYFDGPYYLEIEIHPNRVFLNNSFGRYTDWYDMANSAERNEWRKYYFTIIKALGGDRAIYLPDNVSDLAAYQDFDCSFEEQEQILLSQYGNSDTTFEQIPERNKYHYMIDHFTDIDWESKYVINNNNPIINQ